MENDYKVVVFGAVGAGSSSIGRYLARFLGVQHVDVDAYSWTTPIPWTDTSRAARSELRQLGRCNEGELQGGFVKSCSTTLPEHNILDFLDLAVFVYAPAELRTERLKKRHTAQFGSRILPGGDLHEVHSQFIDDAMAYEIEIPPIRCLALHELWMKTLPCPVKRVDGAEDFEKSAREIAEYLRGLKCD